MEAGNERDGPGGVMADGGTRIDGLTAGGGAGADGPWAVPRGWLWTKLGVVSAVNPATQVNDLDPAAEIPFVPMASVSEETGGIDLTARRPLREVAKGYVRFQTGDVIFAKITPCMENGKIAPVVGVAGARVAGSTEFHVFRPTAVDQRYLWYWLVSRAFRSRAKRNMSGSAGQLRVPVDWLRDAEIPLPPLAEQRRIVARVDALFSEIAEGEAALAEARKGLDTFRRALLKAAVTGELTKDWRAENAVSETGHLFLSRILGERPNDAPARLRRSSFSTGQSRDTTLPPLPDTWAWAQLSSLGKFGRGKSRHRPRDDARLYDGSTPFIQTGIVANADNYIKHFTQTYSDFGVAQSHIWPSGTLCITIAANIAMTAITTFDCCFPDSIVGLTPQEHFSPYWIHIWMQTVQKTLERFAPATAQKNINLQVLEAVLVPIPPPAETTEILRRVSDALAACDDTRAMLDAEAADAARLKQSILKAAFEGRLVPQDPADESAIALLERLAVERPAAPLRKRRGSRRS